MDKKLKDKAIKIKGKEYVQVKDRILYLSESNLQYSIETDYEYVDSRRLWIVKATLTIGDYKFTGLAQEIESEDYKQVNHASALENCETSAVGRACAMAGIGVLDSIASIDEINKAKNRGNQFNSYKGIDVKEVIAKIKECKTIDDLMELGLKIKEMNLSEKQRNWIEEEFMFQKNDIENNRINK